MSKIEQTPSRISKRPAVAQEAEFLEDDIASINQAGLVELLSRLFRETFRSHLTSFGLAIFFMALMASSTAGLAYLMRYAINEIFVAQNISAMWLIASAVVTFSVIKGVADYFQKIIMTKIGNNIVATLQRRLFDKMLSLKLSFFDRTHSSNLIVRINNNAKAARSAIVLVVTSLGRDFLTLIGLFLVMVIQDPILSLAAIALGPPAIYVVYRLVRKIKKLSESEFQGMAQIIASTQETFLGIRTVKSFALEKTMQNRFENAVKSVENRANAIVRIGAITSPLMETLGGILIATIIVYAGWQTISAGKTPGEFMSFITAFLLAYEPAKRLANVQTTLHRNLTQIRRMYDLLDLEKQVETAVKGKIIENVSGHLEFRNVKFGYGKIRVLENICIEANPGEIVALVGPSGGGKSTMFSLIERFYEPGKGSIFIDGVDISEYNLSNLRRHVAVVSQDLTLFSGTIGDNIRYGRIDASDEEVKAAAKSAFASEFIEELSDGYDTKVGERGVTLSGGQAQRIAIARALLKQAPILLLDEATSALDTETERQIKEALSVLMQGRTTIVIAHRFSTISIADHIYVLENGKILESGTHSELISGNRLYRRLFGDGKNQPVGTAR